MQEKEAHFPTKAPWISMAAFEPSHSGAAHEQPNSDAADDRCSPDAFERDEDSGEHDQQCARG